MKRSFFGFAGLAFGALAFGALAGCSQGTPGGPGATGKAPTFGQDENTFNLSIPVLSSSLQQGQKVQASVGIKRAKNFDQDVALTFVDVPKGVTIQPASPMIKHGDTDVVITINAGEETIIGDYKVKISGHPTKGGDAKVDFNMTITAKDTFTLALSRGLSPLKQGESQTGSIGIVRDKTFDQDVTLKFGDLPTGVTMKPESLVVKKGEMNSSFVLTAAGDAALGNFSFKVTGHPTRGSDASTEVPLTVTKKEPASR